MNIQELKDIIERIEKTQRVNLEEIELAIHSIKIGNMGHLPTTPVKNIQLGFDWDTGKLIIYPEQTLREIDRDEIKTLKDNYEELGWSKYKIDRIVKENKRLKEQLNK